MSVTPSRLVATYSPTRDTIYRLLLTDAGRTWTVAQVATARRCCRITGDAARSTLYLLLANAILTSVSGHRAMTMRLTDDGQSFVQQLVRQWAAGHEAEHSHAEDPRPPERSHGGGHRDKA